MDINGECAGIQPVPYRQINGGLHGLSDLFFIYVFLPAAAICYALGRCGDHSRMRRLREYGQPRIRCECPYSNAVLIIFSLIFYAWGEPIYVALMIVSVFMNYVVGVFIDGGRHKSKAALIVGRYP